MHKFGMLFQGAALFDSLPVWENVAFGLLQVKKLRARRGEGARGRGRWARSACGAEVADLSPAELSGGMQKRVGLARAIATQPEILFFDEPTTGLDPIMADVINELIARSVRQLGATAVSITHDMACARKIADRIAMLYQGKIIWQGPVAQIDRQRQPLRRPVHPRPRRGPDQARRPRRLRRAGPRRPAGRLSRPPRRAASAAGGPEAARQAWRRPGSGARSAPPSPPGSSCRAPRCPAPP